MRRAILPSAVVAAVRLGTEWSGDDFVGTCCPDFVLDTGNDVLHAGSGYDSIIAAETPFREPASRTAPTRPRPGR